MLGWNEGTEKEIYSLGELVDAFDMDRVHKGGAKFDYEKAKWFNQEWIKKMPADQLAPLVLDVLQKAGINTKIDEYFLTIIDLVKDRCVLVSDFVTQAGYFYRYPSNPDLEAIQAKWSDAKSKFFQDYAHELNNLVEWNFEQIENLFKQLADKAAIKPGELQLPFRIMLVGGKFGPAVFRIAELLGKEETIARIHSTLNKI
jgi:glutamyl-tRNA synthetase